MVHVILVVTIASWVGGRSSGSSGSPLCQWSRGPFDSLILGFVHQNCWDEDCFHACFSTLFRKKEETSDSFLILNKISLQLFTFSDQIPIKRHDGNFILACFCFPDLLKNEDEWSLAGGDLGNAKTFHQGIHVWLAAVKSGFGCDLFYVVPVTRAVWNKTDSPWPGTSLAAWDAFVCDEKNLTE